MRAMAEIPTVSQERPATPSSFKEKFYRINIEGN
jgi:hypothetical protein